MNLSASELYQQKYATEEVPVEETEKVAADELSGDIAEALKNDPALAASVLEKLAGTPTEVPVEETTEEEPIEKVSEYDENLVKMAQELEAAGRFMAQGFLAGVAEQEDLEKNANEQKVLQMLQQKVQSGAALTEIEQYMLDYLQGSGQGPMAAQVHDAVPVNADDRASEGSANEA
jgi:hypothetical protein